MFLVIIGTILQIILKLFFCAGEASVKLPGKGYAVNSEPGYMAEKAGNYLNEAKRPFL